jgi:fibronectin type 3 domain-containing protein
VYTDPDGITSSYTPTQSLPNIIGHRDVNATECPGDTFYKTLPAVRTTVAARVASGTDSNPPTVPSGLTVTSAKRGFNLTWNPATDAETRVVGYSVYRATATSGPFSRVATTDKTTYADTGASRNATYWYYVTASDLAGNESSPSQMVQATRA